jgi:hypothetical protein
MFLKLQRKPLNVITLGLRETDTINRMMTISGFLVSHCNVEQMGPYDGQEFVLLNFTIKVKKAN